MSVTRTVARQIRQTVVCLCLSLSVTVKLNVCRRLSGDRRNPRAHKNATRCDESTRRTLHTTRRLHASKANEGRSGPDSPGRAMSKVLVKVEVIPPRTVLSSFLVSVAIVLRLVFPTLFP